MRAIVLDGQRLLLTDALEVRDPGPTEVLVDPAFNDSRSFVQGTDY